MHSTPPSLLERLRQPGSHESWKQFADMYTPLLYYWARKEGLQESDAADLVQEVFLDASSGQLLRRLRARHPSVVSVAFSPNGAVLAVGDAAIVRRWDPRSGVLLQELSGHTRGWIVDVAFTPDSRTIFSCGGDNTVRAWDVATGRQAQVLSCNALATNSAVTPDGRLVVAADLTGRIYGWSLE
jgi:WD40 repeat protein